MKSWKTTLTGVMGVLIAGWTDIINPLIDGIDATQPNFTLFIGSATVAFGLIFAKDSNVTGVGADAVAK